MSAPDKPDLPGVPLPIVGDVVRAGSAVGTVLDVRGDRLLVAEKVRDECGERVLMVWRPVESAQVVRAKP